MKLFDDLKNRFDNVEYGNIIPEVPWFPKTLKDLEGCIIFFSFLRHNIFK